MFKCFSIPSEVWNVKKKPLESANNLAYTASYLPLHTDLPYYRYQPGVSTSIIYLACRSFDQIFVGGCHSTLKNVPIPQGNFSKIFTQTLCQFFKNCQNGPFGHDSQLGINHTTYVSYFFKKLEKPTLSLSADYTQGKGIPFHWVLSARRLPNPQITKE